MKELLEKYFDRGDYKIIEDTNETMKLGLRQELSSSRMGTKKIQNNSIVDFIAIRQSLKLWKIKKEINFSFLIFCNKLDQLKKRAELL